MKVEQAAPQSERTVDYNSWGKNPVFTKDFDEPSLISLNMMTKPDKSVEAYMNPINDVKPVTQFNYLKCKPASG